MTKKVTLLLVILLFFIASISSQTSKDTLVASEYYGKAELLLKKRKYSESIAFFKKALSHYERTESWEKVASCYNKISGNQWKNSDYEASMTSAKKVLEISNGYLIQGNSEEAEAYDNIGKCYEQTAVYDKALANYLRALEIRKTLYKGVHSDFAKSYHNLAIVYYRTDALDKTIEYFKKALDVNIGTKGKNYIRNVASYNNLAIMTRQLGDYNKGLEYCQKALAILNTKKERDYLYLSGVYNTISGLYNKLGNLNTALEYGKKSLEIREKEFQGHPKLALSYTVYGNLLAEKGEYSKALEYIEKAKIIYENKLGKNHPFMAEVYTYKGDIFIELKEFSNAIHHLKSALEIEKTSFGEDHGAAISSYEKIGIAYQKKGDFTLSLEYYQKALDLYTELLGYQHPKVAMMFNHIGELYFEQEEIDTSLAYYLRAEKVNSSNSSKTNTIKNSIQAVYLDSNILLETLKGKAKCLTKKYIQNTSIDTLALSVTTYKNIDTLIATVRQSLNNYKDRVTYAKMAKEMYTEAIKVQLLYYNETGEQQFLEQATYYAEKSKANTLKEILNDLNAKDFAGLPVELTRFEKELKLNSSFYQSKITRERAEKEFDTAKIAKYENKLFDINRKKDSLITLLEKNYPKYYQLKHKNEIISVSEIQEKLDNKTTVLEFFTSDRITYAFTISKNTIAVKELATPELAIKVGDLNQSITLKNISDYRQYSYSIYNELIAPIKDKLIGDELIIIPDGPLWHLNFELLLTQNNEAEARNMSYLLRDYAISYANSANLLFNSLERTSKTSKIRNECLAFSFSDSTQLTTTKNMSLATLRDTGDDLPGTRKEIKAISTIVNGQYFYGSEAGEANFKQNVNNYSILHLALHGDVDHKNPQNSKLYFTKSKDSTEDNLLYSHELFALDIPAELAVLSACNTGTGTIAKGEGIMSLGNAFQYAGTKSLLLSGWEVSDKSAPALIENFYTNIANGMNKAKALQKAKLDFLKTASFDQVAPFYWGSFYLLGNTDPIDINKPLPINIYWIVLAFVLIVLALAFVYYRKK
ncbi:CHAT domain-containing protein [Aquimarina sp. 2304DJ70-9]|uniref:CHAT domain-containing protein n=1 Tax=Aquimarina penaris TaxID=3231044 RepID=UPI003463545D